MENQTAFTPGPWEMHQYGETDHHAIYEVEHDGKILARVNTHHFESADEPEANAHLIAAAPEMYEALLIDHAIKTFGYISTHKAGKWLEERGVAVDWGAFRTSLTDIDNWAKQKRLAALAKANGR